jgi:hypothetical protein
MDGGSMRQVHCTDELRRLLDGPYRHIWLRMVSRMPRDGISFSAVAKVLARAAERDRPEGVHPRELRDRVRRALTQGRLTNDTLELFIRAFGIRVAEADRLWKLLLEAPVIPEPRDSDEREGTDLRHR